MLVFFICAGLLGLLAALLTMNVGRLRRKKRIFLGDGGDSEMLAAIRAQGNLLELTPLALLLIWLMHGPYGNRLIAILAVLLTIARYLHAASMLGHLPPRLGRPVGLVVTSGVIVIASIALILAGFSVRIR